MINRIAGIAVLALVFPAHSVRAQGHPQRQAVLTESVLKSMTAQKPKSKTSLSARVGMVRRSVTSGTARSPGVYGPTAVRDIRRVRPGNNLRGP